MSESCPKCAELEAMLWKLREESVAEQFEIEGLKREVARAEKAGAEMRSVLESVAALAPDFLDNEEGHFSQLCSHALSSDCGKEYAHRSEVDTLRAENERLKAENAKLWSATSVEALDLVDTVSKLTQENERLRGIVEYVAANYSGYGAHLAKEALAAKEAK